MGMENMSVEAWVAGETKLERFAGETDGYQLEFDNNNGLLLFVLFSNPTEEERRKVIEAGSIEFAFAERRDCGLMEIKFEGLNWGDCPFEPRLYDTKREYPELDGKEGLKLTIVLIDPAKGGMIVGMRLLGLGHEFSQKFIRWCKSVEEKPFDKEEYHKKLDYVYRTYSVKDLVKNSLFKWKLQ